MAIESIPLRHWFPQARPLERTKCSLRRSLRPQVSTPTFVSAPPSATGTATRTRERELASQEMSSSSAKVRRRSLSRSNSVEGDDSPAREGSKDNKKRRVTKACDQCRKRRIRCDTYPTAAPDAPCRICTEAGTQANCTFTRPSRKRGPQAGQARSLQERCTSMERLLGHLILSFPNLTSSPAFTTFFSPSSTTASPSAQASAFQSSSLPSLLDSLPTPSSISNDIKLDPSPSPSPLSSAQRTVLGHPNSLHALATAASSSAKEENGGGYKLEGMEMLTDGVMSGHRAAPLPPPIPPIPNDLQHFKPESLLPNESIRNQLLDLYFNQIVHPSFPMVDKSRLFRWSATPPSIPVSPELYLAIFAISSPFLSSPSSKSFKDGSKKCLWESIGNGRVGLEQVQALGILALVEWGDGDIARGWCFSALALTLAISLGLHNNTIQPVDQNLSIETDPLSYKLKTFHSILIIHTLLSLRHSKPPLIVLEDYDVPLPPEDGEENFELWRSDKSVEELRAEYEGNHPMSMGSAVMMGGGRTNAVRGSTISTFSQMATLCAIGIGIIRWKECRRRGAKESERRELEQSLIEWERNLPAELRISEVGQRGTEKVGERARYTVEMHLVLYSLFIKLRPTDEALTSATFDASPQAAALNNQILSRCLDIFTLYRSLPTVELALQVLSEHFFVGVEYAARQHDVCLRGYEEMGRIYPVARKNLELLRERVNKHTRELGLKRGTPILNDSSALRPATNDPFQSFLAAGSDIGTGQILDFAQWDQSDLLISLGLVIDPAHSQPWQPPPLANVAATASIAAPETQTPTLTQQYASPLHRPHMLPPTGMLTPPTANYGYGLPQVNSTDLLTRWLDRGTLGFDLMDDGSAGGSSGERMSSG